MRRTDGGERSPPPAGQSDAPMEVITNGRLPELSTPVHYELSRRTRFRDEALAQPVSDSDDALVLNGADEKRPRHEAEGVFRVPPPSTAAT